METSKISHSGLLARSPEGHAARGMQIKGNEDVWVEIQANTFRNWVNENLPAELKVADLGADLCTGVRLCTLVERLQGGRALKPAWNRRPVNRHHYLENVTCALNSIEQDGVKLVNIGNSDIVNGNLKLILGLIWSLIVRYQIGRSKFPPRKLMLAWLQAVLPECRVHNLTTDWNSGVLLSALVDYCQPGLCSHWRKLDKHNTIDNCRNAMDLAQKQLAIPAVLEPEYLASPWLDELSGMTYLSYFMKPGSPGFHATLRWVNSRLERPVKNFTSDWNDGKAISEVIRSLGGSATAPEKLRSDPAYWEANLTQAVEAGKRLGVQPVFSAKDMADLNVEHLGVMAYAAYYQWVPERPPLHDLISVKLDSTSGRVGEPTRYQITLLDSSLSYSKLSTDVRGPDNKYYPSKSLRDGNGVFIPQRIGMHEIIVKYEGEEVSAKHYFRALPPLVEVAPPGMAPCALGSLVQVLVNATGAPRREDILVTAFSPLGRPLECPLTTIDGTNTATFKPDEAGIWRIEITYQGKQIQGGPFTCAVFDPNGVVVSGIEGALPMVPHAIDLDCRDVCVPGDVYADVVYDKRSLHTRMERVDLDGYLHRVHFTPVHPGKHRVYVYFNGYDVKGSPFVMRVGTQRRSKNSSSSPTTGLSSYRHSPVSANQQYTTSSHHATKSSNYTSTSGAAYRPSASPISSETHRYAQDYHGSRLLADHGRRLSADSPTSIGFDHINSTAAGSFIPRASSPSCAPRTQSPTFRPQSPNFRPLSPMLVNPQQQQRPSSPRVDVGGVGVVRRPKSPTMDSRRAKSPTMDGRRAKSPTMDGRRAKSPTMDIRRGNSPSFDNRRAKSPERQSPQQYQYQGRTGSPSGGVGGTSSGFISSRMLNSRSYESSSHSPVNIKTSTTSDDYNGSYLGRMRLGNNRSPALHQGRTSPDYGYTTSANRYNKSVTESRNYNNSFDKVEVLTGVDTVDKNHYDKYTSSLDRMENRLTNRQNKFYTDKSEGVDTTPLIKLSPGGDRSAARRDSWDALSKTRNILSHRSIESLANLNESSLESQIIRDEQHHTTSASSYANREMNVNYKSHQVGKGGATAVRVQDIPDGVLGQPVEFEIDGSGAGSGDLEILVEGGRVTSSVRSLGGQRFKAAFTPHQALPHRVDIRFNGETVPGSPWHTHIMSTSTGGTNSTGTTATGGLLSSTTTTTTTATATSSASSSHLAVLGDSTRLVPAKQPAIFEIITSSGSSASATITPADIVVHVIAPSKRVVPAKVSQSARGGGTGGVHSVEFVPSEVGTHVIEVTVHGEKLPAGPLIAKVYDAGLIQVADVSGGVVGQPVQFRVDASQAGEGQLEISINEGEVPNHVQVVGGGRCLVSFTPDTAKPHLIDIKFNAETVRGCPFICAVADTSRVTLSLAHLELIPVNQTSSFHMGVAGGGAAELAVAVRGPVGGELPVKVTGDIHSGFTAEFTPSQVGAHQISVDYNSRPVQGTPFVAKAFDSTRVTVGQVARGTVGRPVTFSVDASEAGEGNLEITISARGLNIPTQVHPQGNAKFAVSFVPAEACDHVVNVAFNKRPVVGCPLVVGVGGGGLGPSVTLPGPGPVNRASTLLISHPGRLEDIEVNVEGPGGQAVPTQVQPLGNGQFRAEFVPRVVGEHRISVSVAGAATAGSPYAAKVYDVQAIKVKEAATGVVGKPVTFLVETSQAGPGNLEVTVNGGRVPTSAQAQGPHTYAISFTPRDATAHAVDLRFNGQDVPGSPFQCVVVAAARVLATTSASGTAGAGGTSTGDGGETTLDKVAVGRVCTFAVESPGTVPVVEVLGPARRSLPTQITPQTGAQGKYDISFTPLDVGDHSVEVRLPGGHIEGSPFLIKAYDANRVSVTDINDGIVGKPVSFSINASQAGAGNLEIIVAVGGRNVPNFVQSEGNARFKVNFKPTEAAVHTLSVRFNGQAVPGSPFSCKVSPGNTQPRVPVSGSGIELAAIGQPAEIKIEGITSGVEPQVIATAPNGKILATQLTGAGGDSSSQQQHIARFTPETVGRHSVAIMINDQHVIGSPFHCNVYDVNKVIVSGLPGRASNETTSRATTASLPPAQVGKPVTFSVDAAQAGEGTLELVVSTQHTTIKAEVVACARGLYDVTFVPQSSEDHFVNITFNDMNVLGSPFHCPVIESTQFLQIGSQVSTDVPSGHRIDIRDVNDKPVKYIMSGGGGHAEFSVPQTGSYQVTLTRDGETVLTRTIHVFDTGKVDVINAPEPVCHRPAVIGVNINKAGPGTLTAQVKVANKDVPHSVRQSATNSNMYDIVFHPVDVAPHRITLFYNEVPKPEILEIPIKAPGSEPWAGGLGLYQAKVGKVNSFNIDTLGRPAREFDVIVSGPTGSALPVRCYQTKTGKLQAEFTARDIGSHTVEVLHQAKPLGGSPFVCEVFDVDSVRIVDVPNTQGNVGEKIIFNVTMKNAGQAALEVTVTNPIGQTVAVSKVTPDDDDNSNNTTEVSFLPTAAGLYQVTVTYGGVPVKGSPLALGVGPVGPIPPPRAVGRALEYGQLGDRCTFIVSSAGQPRVQVDAIEGTVDAQVQCTKPGEWLVSYTPKWVGVYDIVIGIGGTDLPGSPFRPVIVDPSSVRLIGGWTQHLDDTSATQAIRLPAKLVFDTAQAGPGALECKVAGRKVAVEKTATRCKVDLSGEGLNGGEHEFELRFGQLPVPETPKMVVSYGDQVVLTGRGLAQAQCNEPAVFTIDGTKAGTGNPEVTLHSADTNLPIPVMISLAGEKSWRATYTITTPGNYLLSVLWNARPVKGCPLMVEAKGGADASKVLCSGEGLRQGVVGREIRSWIDTRRAGPGELTAHCTGPRKVAYCELYDHGDATFTLNVKPQEPGRHALTIKYAGQHVTGSPFTLRVAGAPDASKVRVYGPGVEHGVLATFQSRFICDTRGAGAGQLTVRVRGPKGAFRVEMQRESQKDRTILNKYDPTEPGDYRVEVKWAGELVPGSPFHVMIFDTQEELRRYINSI